MSKSKKSFNISMEETLVYPSLTAETRYPVRKADWDRLKCRLSNIQPEDKFLRTVYSASFGVAASTAIGFFALYWTETKPPWSDFAFGFCTIFALVLAVILFLHDRKDTKSSTGDIKLILDDMEEIEAGFEQDGQVMVADSAQVELF